MAQYDITVPPIGEGEHEVRLIGLLKNIGESVQRDEPLYEVETSKADMTLESPVAGRVTDWVARIGDVVAIGAVVGRIELNGADTAGPPADDERLIPPRTRAYARSLGLSDADLAAVPAAGRRLLPEDIDRHLAAAPAEAEPGLTERLLDAKQQQFISQLRQTQATAVPATMRHRFGWDAVRAVAARRELRVTPFSVLAYCVARATADHPLLRSALIDDRLVRESPHVNLGVGVEIPPDSLGVAVIAAADALAPVAFSAALRSQVKAVMRGESGRSAPAHLLLSFIPTRSVLDGTPVLVSPAVATLFVGMPFAQGEIWFANASLTFDHRLINGGPAARFLRSVGESIEQADQVDWTAA